MPSQQPVDMKAVVPLPGSSSTPDMLIGNITKIISCIKKLKQVKTVRSSLLAQHTVNIALNMHVLQAGEKHVEHDR